MMISPESYADTVKDRSYEELVRIRDRLIREIRRFEKKRTTEDWNIVCPSPDVVYQMNNDYLIEITRLLNEKFNLMVNGTDEE